REQLADVRGLVDELVPVDGTTRRTIAVVDDRSGGTTQLNEPGPPISPAEWSAFQEAYAALLPAASAVALCGSLPPGVPVGAYAGLLRTARAAGVPTLLDTSGSALRRGIAGRPGILKPNADELAELTGSHEPSTATRDARRRGAGAVVASLGPDGPLAVTPEGRRRAPPPARPPPGRGRGGRLPGPGRPARRAPRGPLARHSPGPPARQPDRRGRLGRRGPAVGPGREPPLAGPPHPRGRPVGGDGPLPGGR